MKKFIILVSMILPHIVQIPSCLAGGPVHEGTWYYEGRQPVYEQSYRYFVNNEEVHILFDRELDDHTRLGLYRFMKAWAPFTKTENRRAGNPLINLYETLRGGLDSDTSFLRFYFFAENISGDKTLVEQMSQREESLPALLAYQNLVLGGGQTVEGDFVVDPTISKIAVVLLGNAPGVEFVDPDGNVSSPVSFSGPNLEGLVSRYYEQSSPKAGVWRYRIMNPATDSATYSIRVKAESALRLNRMTDILRAYNTPVPFELSLAGRDGSKLGASVRIDARPLVDGKTISDTVVTLADLNDSGLPGDDTASDGIYAANVALPSGVYTVLATAEGEVEAGIPFRRLYQMVLVNRAVPFFLGQRTPVGPVADATPEIHAELVAEGPAFFDNATYKLVVNSVEIPVSSSDVIIRTVGSLQVREVRQTVAAPQPKGSTRAAVKVTRRKGGTRPFPWQFSITTSEAAPPILINEVSMVRRCKTEVTQKGGLTIAKRVCKRRPGDDWVELYAREAVDLSNVYAITTLDQFPEVIVQKRTRLKAGEYAVVHVGEVGVDEDDVAGDVNGNGIRDFYVSSVKFPINPATQDDQVVLKRWDQIVDAVCLSNGDDRVNRGEDVDQALVIGQGEWSGPFPPADIRNSALHGGTLTSVGRKAKGVESNRAEDWDIQAFPSPGTDNVGSLPRPAVGSILITEVQSQGNDQWVELSVVNGPIDISRLFMTNFNIEGILGPLAESRMVIAPGGRVQIHWNLTGQNETDDVGDMNRNGIRELYLGLPPLQAPNDQLLLSSLFDPLDAVIWTRGDLLISDAEVSDANEIVSKGMWNSPFSPPDTGLSVLLPPPAFTIGRKVGNPDGNSSADWVGMAPTPGIENVEAPVPTSQNILINEVHPNDFFNDDRDWAELFVQAGPVDVHLMKLTNLDGKDRVLGSRPITIPSGEFAVVWFGAAESATLTEYDDVGDLNQNGYRDIYIRDNPLFGTDDQLALMHGRQIVDAVAWTNGDGLVWRAQFGDERDIVAAGQWTGDYFDTTVQEPSVFLNTTDGSISRFPNGVDTNKKDDWRIVLKTPGHPNVDVDLDPPRIVIDPIPTPTKQNVTLKIFVSDNVSPPGKITATGDNSPYTTEGQHDVTITATDEAGNTASRSASFFIDKTLPFFVRFSPLGGETFIAKRDTILISVEAKDAVDADPTVFAQIVHSVGGVSDTAITVVDNQQITPLSIPAGQWKLVATAKDAAGNIRTQEGGFFTVIHDALPPRTALTVGDPKFVRSSDSAAYITATTPLTFAAVDDLATVGDAVGLGVAKIEVSVNGGAFATVSGPLTLTGLGEGKHTVSYRATDVVGNVEASQTAVLYIDATAPVTTDSKTPAANKNGWNAADVSVSLSAIDPTLSDNSNSGSGVKETRLGVDGAAPTTYTTATTLSAEGVHTVAFFSVDNIGNTEPLKADTVRIDKTLPVVNANREPPANKNNWNRDPVFVSYAATDTLSGIDTSISDLVTDVLTKEAAGQSTSAFAVDLAGNTTTTVLKDIHIDLSNPIISAMIDPPANVHGWHNQAVTVNFSETDALSGIDTAAMDTVMIVEGANQTATGFAVDQAWNTGILTVSNINIDFTAPAIALQSIAPDSTGLGLDGRSWWNQTVAVTFSETETLSGIDPTRTSLSFTLANEGKDQSVTGIAVDKADNTSTLTVSGINIDFTAPVVSHSIGAPQVVQDGQTFVTSQTLLSFAGTDTLSGMRGITVTTNPTGLFAGLSQKAETLAGNLTQEGQIMVAFSGEDIAANKSQDQSATLIVDNTVPATTRSVDITDTSGTVLIPQSEITLSAVDGPSTGLAVGVDRIEYRFDVGPVVVVGGPTKFDVSTLSFGPHTLTYQSFDRLGNAEPVQTFNFVVSPALAASKFLSFAPRVLVWLNGKEEEEDDDEDEKDKGIPAANVAVLKSILDSAPILLYDIVENSDSFVSFMRTDSYNVYVIIGDEKDLDKEQEWELSERVWMGDGLVSSFMDEIEMPVHDKGEHEGKDKDDDEGDDKDKGKDEDKGESGDDHGKGKDKDHGEDDEHGGDDDGDKGKEDDHDKDSKAAKNLLGVDVDGKHSEKNIKISLTGAAIPFTGEYQTTDKTKRVRAMASPAVGDGFVTPKGKDKESEATVVSNAFGSGKTVFLAFDLGRSATPGNTVPTGYLLTAAIQKVTPTKEVLIPDGRAAIGMTMQSLVVPLNLAVRIEEVVPAGASVVNKLDGNVQSNSVIWNMTLDVNESDTVQYVLGLPNVGEANVTTSADVSYVVRGNYILFDTLKLTLVTEKDLPNLLDQAIVELQGLSPTDKDDQEKVKDAVEELQKQKNTPPATKKDIEEALEEVLEIIRDLDGVDVDAEDMSDIRETLDKVTLVYGRKISSL